MIYNEDKLAKDLTEEQFVKIFAHICNIHGNVIILNAVYDEMFGISLREQSKSSTDAHIINKNNERWIVIDKGTNNHGPRMMVTIRTACLTSYACDRYISILRMNDGTFGYEGSRGMIGMLPSECDAYINLFLRNENLINLAKDPAYLPFINGALLEDEKLRVNDFVVERDNGGKRTIKKYVDGSMVIMSENDDIIQ